MTMFNDFDKPICYKGESVIELKIRIFPDTSDKCRVVAKCEFNLNYEQNNPGARVTELTSEVIYDIQQTLKKRAVKDSNGNIVICRAYK